MTNTETIDGLADYIRTAFVQDGRPMTETGREFAVTCYPPGSLIRVAVDLPDSQDAIRQALDEMVEIHRAEWHHRFWYGPRGVFSRSWAMSTDLHDLDPALTVVVMPDEGLPAHPKYRTQAVPGINHVFVLQAAGVLELIQQGVIFLPPEQVADGHWRVVAESVHLGAHVEPMAACVYTIENWKRLHGEGPA